MLKVESPDASRRKERQYSEGFTALPGFAFDAMLCEIT